MDRRPLITPQREAAGRSLADRVPGGQGLSAPDLVVHRGDGTPTGPMSRDLYPWHPSAGRRLHIHVTVERVGLNVLRCNIGGWMSERCLEVPAWMFDRGFCAKSRFEAAKVFIAHSRGITPPTIKRELRRRNAVEPIIGHTKSDGLLEPNHLAGATGDAINAVLVAAGHNMRLLLAWLVALWRVLITRHLLETQPRHANALRRRARHQPVGIVLIANPRCSPATCCALDDVDVVLVSRPHPIALAIFVQRAPGLDAVTDPNGAAESYVKVDGVKAPASKRTL